MAIDPNKKRVVFLKYDQILNLTVLAQMHLDSGGAPKILQKYPVSEEYAQSLRESMEIFNKLIAEIAADEE